jgi:hypothetical protein
LLPAARPTGDSPFGLAGAGHFHQKISRNIG